MTISAKQLVSREVGHCVSSLVATLANGAAYPGALSDLIEQAFNLAAPVDDYEEAAREAGWTHVGKPRGWQPTKLPKSYGGPFYKTAESLCHFEDIEPHAREVYEHWIVSDWLADKLIAHGEKVDKDFAGLCVWARTCTGQAISIDWVMEQIAAEVNAS